MRQQVPGEYETGWGGNRLAISVQACNRSAGLRRDEMELAKQELKEKARTLRTAVTMTAIAVILGIIALFTLDAPW